MTKHILSLLTLLLPLSVWAFGAEQAPHHSQGELTAKLDQLFAQWDNNDSPGCAVMVVKDGETLFKQGYGMANLEHNAPILPHTVFRAASIAKQFTAACVFKMVGEEKLSLQDPLSKFFPEMPSYADNITIYQLLYHTSGLRDFLQLAELSGYSHHDFFSNEEVMKLIVQQQTLNFAPGTDQLYNNSGYFLLAKIVENISGVSFGDYARLHLFEPLGMNSTRFFDDRSMIIKHRATGYAPSNNGSFKRSTSPLTIVGDGGLMTTVEDLTKWQQNFNENKLKIKDFKSNMLQPGRLGDGTPLSYAAGLDLGQYRGLATFGHSGAFVGFRGETLSFPEQGLSIVCLSNSSGFQPGKMNRKVADLVLDYLLSPEKPLKNLVKTPSNPKEVLISPYIFEPYVGKYELGSGMVIDVHNDGGSFFLNIVGQAKFQIFPESETQFFVKETDLEVAFTRGKQQKTEGLLMTIGSRKIYAKKMAQKVSLNDQELSEYTGTYYNQELNVSYKLIKDQESLYLQIGKKPKELIDLLKKDNLIMADGTAQFLRDKEGNITAFTFSSGDVKNLNFQKL